MTQEDIIWAASVAIGKRLDFTTLYYSDYMYGNESKTGIVWAYVEECEQIGTIAFKEKYAQFKMYPI